MVKRENPLLPGWEVDSEVAECRAGMYDEYMTSTSSRTYRLGKRRDSMEETRRRIVEAAVELHGTVGPAETTISAVAERAGVQRSTVYRHYPDEAALFGACTSHWLARHPFPRPADWAEWDDPRQRLEAALGILYRYYEDNAAMLANSYRDIDVMPGFVAELMRAQVDAVHASLMEAWTGEDDRSRLAIAIAHGIDFPTGRSLAAAGLEPAAAAELMADMIGAVAG